MFALHLVLTNDSTYLSLIWRKEELGGIIGYRYGNLQQCCNQLLVDLELPLTSRSLLAGKYHSRILLRIRSEALVAKLSEGIYVETQRFSILYSIDHRPFKMETEYWASWDVQVGLL